MSEVAIQKNDLPSNWGLVELQDVCSKITDGTHKTPKYLDEGVRFISIKNIKPFKPVNWDSYVKFISQEEHELLSRRCNPEWDDILFPRIGTLGYAKRVDFKEEVSLFVGLGLAKPNKEVIYPKYLEFWMNHPLIDKLSRERANGSGRLTLPLAESKKLPVPLAPYEQQKLIVAKIEELFSHIDAGIDALKKAKQLLKQYRQSVLKAAVTGELTKQWREENKDKLEPASQLLDRILTERRQKWEKQQFEQFKTKGKMPKDDKWKAKYKEPEKSADIEVPDSWVAVSLDQITEYITSGSRGWAKYYSDSGATFIRAQNLKYDELKLDDVAFVSLPDKAEGMRTRVKFSDILVTITGANVTKTGVVDVEIDEAYVSQHVALCRPVLTGCASYIYKYLVSKDGGRKELESAAYGAGKPGLNLDNLKTLVIALPSLIEQEKVIYKVNECFLKIERLDKELNYQIKKAAKNKQSILASAFSGKICDAP